MAKKRGQISVEWVTLIVFVSMMVIPGIYFLTLSFGDVKGDYEYYNLESYGDEIVENAERMFFAGLYSKTTLTPDIGNEYIILNQVFSVTLTNVTHAHNYLVFNLTDWDAKNNLIFYPSDIELKTSYCTDINTGVYVPECGVAPNTCIVCLLNSTEFLYSNLQIETILVNDNLIVNLTYQK